MEETLKGNKNKALIGLLVLALLGAAAWQLGWLPSAGGDTYQAVFLSNSQVYFGKLANKNSQYPVLTDIYYLKVIQPLQPSQPNPNVSLIKLGDELHGPADKMEINRDQILFVEDLKENSQVVTAIRSYKAGK